LKIGWCVWVTGLPGSGKSVVSRKLIKILNENNMSAQLLSSDALRKSLTPKPSYSLEERDMVYKTLDYIAILLVQNGVNVVIDATGNLRRYRDELRCEIPHFVEVYLECPQKECIKREAKRREFYNAPQQIYSKAFEGKTKTVPGVGQPYEQPLSPEVRINTFETNSDQGAQKILNAIISTQK
jgi:adenylylsulfate kinase